MLEAIDEILSGEEKPTEGNKPAKLNAIAAAVRGLRPGPTR
jgi:hypothetical protein